MATSPRDPRELGGAWTRHQRHTFTLPSDGLAPFIERFWMAEWEYAEPYEQKILPFPQVQLTVRNGAAPEVHGVSTRHVLRRLVGHGRVVGAAFRPGVFRVILQRPVSSISDAVVLASKLPALHIVPSSVDGIDGLEQWLLAVLPEPDSAGREAGDLVELVRRETAILRVDALAATAGLSVRRLQRLFAEHVGVGPKWVIRRYRLHEVTERLAAGEPISWAALAADLGYADQAHLSRDFTDLLGEPPTSYAERYPARASHGS